MTTLEMYEKEESKKVLLPVNQFKYYKLGRETDLVVKTDKKSFFSHFKPKPLAGQPKLVLHIFIDGCAYDFFKEKGLQNTMPHTAQFFQQGYWNENCYANGEWTLPSLMSMFTGKYTVNHNVFHPKNGYPAEQASKLMQEFFYEAGYHTGFIHGNWRSTPMEGYFKGANRLVYSPMFERMLCDEVIAETIEHLEAFKDFHNFVHICLGDLHTIPDQCNRGLFNDVSSPPVFGEAVEDNSNISVFKKYDPQKMADYCGEMLKIDLYLELLYHYILENYREDEFIVVVQSDHGQGFLSKDESMFSRYRTKVPFLARGRGVPAMVSREVMNNVDMLPTLLQLCGISCDEAIDGKILKDFGGVERPYAISESLYPGQTYKCAINDKEHLFAFETERFVMNDGRIPLQPYQFQLLNKASNRDEQDKYPEKVAYYLREVFEHVKEWIVF